MKDKNEPIIEITSRPGNVYGDDDIPEIDLPKPTNATNVIPDEVPRRDGPGGE